jgi:hypothetical protein
MQALTLVAREEPDRGNRSCTHAFSGRPCGWSATPPITRKLSRKSTETGRNFFKVALTTGLIVPCSTRHAAIAGNDFDAS